MNSECFAPLKRRLDDEPIEAILTGELIMARTQTISEERLLQAARAEFLEHGINVTSAAIARRAGVSPGILFHRFGSKEALFAAAMNVENDTPSASSPHRPFDLRHRVGKGTVQQTLTDVGEFLLDRFFTVVPNQLMAWANPDVACGLDVAQQFRERGVRGQRQLVEYLQAEARLKRIRLGDPFVVVQSFSGALWFFAFEQVTGAKLRSTDKPPSRGEFVRRLVDSLWRGLRP
ncbi:MAG: helix-turn-helix domain-containing protein [Polyangia bacterium]|jgi:AcrR family transcriptional regulator